MNIEKYLDVIHTVGKLKDTTRHCYTPGGRHESVGEHTYRIVAMAFFLKDEFPEADHDKLLKMCLIHDFGEIFTGDIPSFDKTRANEDTEARLLNEWVDSIPEPYKSEMKALYEEMEARETLEARIYKALDNLEAVISHNESDLSTWEDREYILNRTYGEDKCAFSDYLTGFRRLVKEETDEKIAKERK